MKKALFLAKLFLPLFCFIFLLASCAEESGNNKSAEYLAIGYGDAIDKFSEELLFNESKMIINGSYDFYAVIYKEAENNSYDYSKAVWTITPSNVATASSYTGRSTTITPTTMTGSLKINVQMGKYENTLNVQVIEDPR